MHQPFPMASSGVHEVLFVNAVLCTHGLCMLHTASQYSLYLHSYLTSILIHASAALSLLFPCDCYAAAAVSASVTEKELLFFYLSLQCHLSLLICLLLTSIALCYDLLFPFHVASPILCTPSA